MYSPNGDQPGQWRSISMTSQCPLIMTLTMGNDVARDAHCEITNVNGIHCDIRISNDFAMCTHHVITMNNEPLLLYIFYFMPNCAILLWVVWNKNKK